MEHEDEGEVESYGMPSHTPTLTGLSGKRRAVTYLIRTDGNASLGIGHVKRCLSLANTLESPVVFALRHASSAVKAVIHNAGHSCLRVGCEWSKEPEWLRSNGGRDGVILDLSHALTIAQPHHMYSYVAKLQSLFPVVSLIDGMGPDSLCSQTPVQADLTVVPYVGARAGNSGVWLVGPRYCILKIDRSDCEGRVIRTAANRILVTAGGADLQSVTIAALEGIRTITDLSLNVRVVQGTEFTQSLRTRIAKCAEALHTSITLLDSPESLISQMLWCDICIATSGLTKYELAATGTPAILISPDWSHMVVDEHFARSGTAISVGPINDVPPSLLATTVQCLLEDFGRRTYMSNCGYGLVDGKGASRVAGAIREVRNVVGRQTTQP